MRIIVESVTLKTMVFEPTIVESMVLKAVVFEAMIMESMVLKAVVVITSKAYSWDCNCKS